jgi:hypothetical protein
MPNQHGGPRTPAHPAAVSGPGALSQRTDGRPGTMPLPDAKYGEAANFAQIQAGASMATPNPQMAMPSPGAASTAPMPTPMGDPTAQPSTPVTAGAAVGPGVGAEALGLPNTSNEVADLTRRYGDILPLLIRKADDPRSSQQFKDQVRYLISKIT